MRVFLFIHMCLEHIIFSCIIFFTNNLECISYKMDDRKY